MGEIRDRMVADLTLRGAAQNTCEAYLRFAHAFVAFHRRSPTELGTEHVRAWLLHLLQEKRRSPRTVNVAIAALRFLCEVTLGRPEVMATVRTVRVQHHQPDVPSGKQVATFLEHARTPKHRAMFMLLYGTGLRISELLALQPAGDKAFKAPRGQRPHPLRPATVRVRDVRSTLAVLRAVLLKWWPS